MQIFYFIFSHKRLGIILKKLWPDWTHIALGFANPYEKTGGGGRSLLLFNCPQKLITLSAKIIINWPKINKNLQNIYTN